MMQQMLCEITQVTPSLYLSAASAITEEKIANLGINLIVNATKELMDIPSNKVTKVRVPVYDNSEAVLFPYFRPVCSLLLANDQNGGKSLIYCLAGRSRSAALCIAYLILKKKAEENNPKVPAATQRALVYSCLDDLRKLRPFIQPNPGFMRQLLRWDEGLSKAVCSCCEAPTCSKPTTIRHKSERSLVEAINLIQQAEPQIRRQRNAARFGPGPSGRRTTGY